MVTRNMNAVEVMQLLHIRHPDIGMALEILVQPACASLLGSDADEKVTYDMRHINVLEQQLERINQIPKDS